MLPKIPICPPTSYVSAIAVGYSDQEGKINIVGQDGPMPVTTVRGDPPEPMTGTAGQSSVAGPFYPLQGQPIHLQLEGDWTGEVELQRSIDNGTSLAPVTLAGMPWGRYSANANEAVWQEVEDGASLFLAIRLNSGAVNYRLSQ